MACPETQNIPRRRPRGVSRRRGRRRGTCRITAQCPEERTLGLAAARRLRELVASGRTQLVPDRRQRDKYGSGLASSSSTVAMPAIC